MSRFDMENAIKWWQKQYPKYEIVGTGYADFTNGFCEIFWKHGDDKGRDRIRKKGSEYILEVIK